MLTYGKFQRASCSSMVSHLELEPEPANLWESQSRQLQMPGFAANTKEI